MIEAIVAIIGAILGVVGAAVGGASNRKAVEAQAEANQALSDRQNEQNIENWKMQNEYNSPENQMELYKRAGINPYLIAGKSGGSVAGSVAPAVGYQTDVTSPYRSAGELVNQFKDSVNWLLGAKLQQKNVDKVEADIRKTHQEVENLKTQQTLQQTENSLKLFDLTEMNPLTRSKVKNEISNIVKRNLLLDLQTQNQQIQNSAAMYNLDYMLPLEYARHGVDLQAARYNLDYILPADYEIKDASVANTRMNTYYTMAKRTNQRLRNEMLDTFGTETPGQLGGGAGAIGFNMARQSQQYNKGLTSGLGFYIDPKTGLMWPKSDRSRYHSVGGSW